MKLMSYLRRAAVLGAGRSGPLLAAQLANAGVEVWLYDLPTVGDDPLDFLRRRVAALQAQEPPVLAEAGRAALIHPVCFGESLEALQHCDLVLEAVAEDLDVKTGLYVRITPFLAEEAILATTTSSLSVNSLARALPEVLRWRFCGLHVLSPHRQVPLVELVPSEFSDPRVLARLETLLVTDLGKGVIRVRDRPFFVAGRLGLYALGLACHHGERLGLVPDLVDVLAGSALGRPRAGDFGLLQGLGLETAAGLLQRARQCLPGDPWLARLRLPRWLLGGGESGYRHEADADLAPPVRSALAIPDPGERWAALRAGSHPQARFLWAMQRDLYHYAATWLGEIADSARDLDLALRWGLGWREGLFETWQRTGWRQVAGWLATDIEAGRTLVDTPLPAWVARVQAVHSPRGSLVPTEGKYQARPQLAVYRRQLLPETLAGETLPVLGTPVWQRGPARLLDSGEDIAIVDWSAAAPALDSRLVESLHEALEQSRGRFRGLVLWRGAGAFSDGADAVELLTLLARRDHAALARLQTRWQGWLDTCRDLPIPVVAVVQGRCFGLGAALLLYCDRVVSALESRFALLVPRLGLPPGAGLAALARRAYRQAGTRGLALLHRSWPWLATAGVARSGLEARELGLLTAADVVLMNPAEGLFVARRQAGGLADSGYRSPLELPLPVPGPPGRAALRQQLDDTGHGQLAEELAGVLTGGDTAPGDLLTESAHRQLEAAQWLDWCTRPRTRDALIQRLEE